MACENFSDLLPDVYFSRVELDKSNTSDDHFAQVTIGFQEVVDTEVERAWFDNLDGQLGEFEGLSIRVVQSTSREVTEGILAFLDDLRLNDLGPEAPSYVSLTQRTINSAGVYASMMTPAAPQDDPDSFFLDKGLPQFLVDGAVSSRMTGAQITKGFETRVAGSTDKTDHLTYFAFTYIDYDSLPLDLRPTDFSSLTLRESFPIGNVSMVNLKGEYNTVQGGLTTGPGRDLFTDLTPIRNFKQSAPSIVSTPEIDIYDEIGTNLGYEREAIKGLKDPVFSVLWNSRDLNEDTRLTFAINQAVLAKQNIKIALFSKSAIAEKVASMGLGRIIKTERIELQRKEITGKSPTLLVAGEAPEYETIASHPSAGLHSDARLDAAYEHDFRFYTATDRMAKTSRAAAHKYRVVVTLKDNSFEVLSRMYELTATARSEFTATKRKLELYGNKPLSTRATNTPDYRDELTTVLAPVVDIIDIISACNDEESLEGPVGAYINKLQVTQGPSLNLSILEELETVIIDTQDILLKALKSISPNFAPQGNISVTGAQPGQRPRNPITQVIHDFEVPIKNNAGNKTGLEYLSLTGVQNGGAGFPGYTKDKFQTRATKEIEKFYKDITLPNQESKYTFFTPSIIRAEDGNGEMEIIQTSTRGSTGTYDYNRYAELSMKLYTKALGSASPESFYSNHDPSKQEPREQTPATSFRRRLEETSCVARTSVDGATRSTPSLSFDFFGTPGEGESDTSDSIIGGMSSPRVTNWTPTTAQDDPEPTRLLMTLSGEMTQGIEDDDPSKTSYNSFAMVDDKMYMGSDRAGVEQENLERAYRERRALVLERFYGNPEAVEWSRRVREYLRDIYAAFGAPSNEQTRVWYVELNRLSNEVENNGQLSSYIAALHSYWVESLSFEYWVGDGTPPTQHTPGVLHYRGIAMAEEERGRNRGEGLYVESGRWESILRLAAGYPSLVLPDAEDAEVVDTASRLFRPISLQALTDMSFYVGDGSTDPSKIKQPTYQDKPFEVSDLTREMQAIDLNGGHKKVYDLMKDYSKFAAFWFNFKSIMKVEQLTSFREGNIKDPIWERYVGREDSHKPDGLCRLASYDNSQYGVMTRSVVSIPTYNEYFLIIENLTGLAESDLTLGQGGLQSSVPRGADLAAAGGLLPEVASVEMNVSEPQMTPTGFAPPFMQVSPTNLFNVGQQEVNMINRPPPAAVGPIGGRFGSS